MKKLKLNKKRLLKLGWPFLILFILAVIVFRERIGLQLEEVDDTTRVDFEARLSNVKDSDFSQPVEQTVECLIVSNSEDEQSNVLHEDMEYVLDEMRVQYDVCDLSKDVLPDLSQYKKVVVTLQMLDALGKDIVTLCDWVEAGGQLMSTGTFANDGYWEILASKAGVLNASDADFEGVSGIRILNDFMINAEDQEFTYEEESDMSLDVALIPDCIVHIEDIKTGSPLLWEVPYGEGKFVINNQVVSGKAVRGIFCASYSLLGDICVYPVINASAFYIDDFPSPVPQGDGTYIERDYGVSISTFYANIWWPDMLALEDKYGIIHTGLIIEDYSDIVEAPSVETEEVERFTFFGNMLLNAGGELGFHGYNHMPLCLEDYDYNDEYDSYNKWPSVRNMEEAITEVKRFGEELFPEATFSVYVPPSNILSEEGREALKNSWPDLKMIASIYFPGEVEYEQDFCVAEDGIIETPRITSGCDITEYMMLAAFSELNLHFVQSHFLHPDDVLDEDRGAELGWEKLYDRFTGYIDYVYESAPMIRNVSGSGMGVAVREYDKLSVERIESENTLELRIGGFCEEGYFLVRVNSGKPVAVKGGSIQHVSGDLYLLNALHEDVLIRYR